MKILIAPSKTKDLKLNDLIVSTNPLFMDKTNIILNRLRRISKKNLAKAMKIKGEMLDKVYQDIKNFEFLNEGIAITSFNGLVYKGLNIDEYNKKDFSYIKENLLILDAFYGIIEPSTLIKDYRLDFLMKLGFNLYDFWDVEKFIDDELIINLASTEFSKMIKSKTMITISFLQKKDDKFVNQATYSKQARGIFLDYMIKNKIRSIEEIKNFNSFDYQYNEDLSDEVNIIFTR